MFLGSLAFYLALFGCGAYFYDLLGFGSFNTFDRFILQVMPLFGSLVFIGMCDMSDEAPQPLHLYDGLEKLPEWEEDDEVR